MSGVHVTEKHQSVWELASIQLCGWLSLPILATSVLLLQENSFYGALLTILIAYAILWFIRLGIVLMSHEKRQSTLDISRAYLGNVGSHFIGVLLLVSTLAWFIVQTTAATRTLTHLLVIRENPNIDQFVQVGVFLGVCSTFLCMKGIVALREFTKWVFPVFILAFVAALWSSPFPMPKAGETVFSLSGIGIILATNLGITADLPTFFRHSQSLRTSVIALTVIQLVSLALAVCGLYIGSVLTGSFEINEAAVLGTGSALLRVSLIVFVFLSVLCANVANVYSASVGWEVVAPSALVGHKEYAILGFGLTLFFLLASELFSMQFLLSVSDYSLVNLCVVLILGYVIARITKKRPGFFDQGVYFAAWLLSTGVNTWQFCVSDTPAVSPLGVGILMIVCVIFLSLILKKLFKGAIAI